MNKLQLYDVRVPTATESYSPVAHKDIIEAVQDVSNRWYDYYLTEIMKTKEND